MSKQPQPRRQWSMEEEMLLAFFMSKYQFGVADLSWLLRLHDYHRTEIAIRLHRAQMQKTQKMDGSCAEWGTLLDTAVGVFSESYRETHHIRQSRDPLTLEEQTILKIAQSNPPRSSRPNRGTSLASHMILSPSLPPFATLELETIELTQMWGRSVHDTLENTRDVTSSENVLVGMLESLGDSTG
ncbi:hypothetical protein AOL_s00091g18 [Orbilia oligospora ATCC 24927]|uniref:Uncharacterized protein n=1 Tax=Arthrobotrys oligospora (strain ATCC 24927 / CBS 115.81 / DSM 1491) TaxID=756982 RepID=G1XHW6_ARTOA|nr:hypothetical protein AOL_s00091g18 [Orbilia oligospora ATCC 24927]EGX47274.1 hypothetical protein AOL_s00091g18 [Orbilia oligospora ATCC 24927]